MSKFNYTPLGNSGITQVSLDGQAVGQIKKETAPFGSPVAFVFRYWPNGVKVKGAAGSPYTSLALCKKSLESE